MLTHEQKCKRLAALTEDQFRDQVVRQLFVAQGLRSYRDVCGKDEEGKDCILLREAEFGRQQVYVVQTKTTKLNLALGASANVTEAITQLRTAASTKVTLLHSKVSVRPDQVFLITSGSANTAARRHIAEELAGTNLTVLDRDEVIDAIDKWYPSFWINISRYNRRYVETLRERLLSMPDTVLLYPGDPNGSALAPITDQAYIPLTLFRLSTRMSVKRGTIKTKPLFDEISGEKLLDASPNIVFLLADAGEGKTTLLRRLCLIECERSLMAERTEDCPLPVLFRAVDLIQADDLREAIEEQLRDNLKEAESGLSDTDYDNGRVRVFIDAIDETGCQTGYSHVLNLIKEFRSQWPKCRVIATTRPLLTVKEFASENSCPIYQLSDFSLKQAAAIVGRAAAGKEIQPSAVTEVLRRLQDVHGMKLSPLLVTVFAATPNFHSKDIPPNISAIFRKFASLMLGQWDEQKGLSRQYEWEQKHAILGNIAFQWHNGRVSSKPVDVFRAEVRQVLESWGKGDRGEAVADEILESGLLSISDGGVSFRHHLFQEYFAASIVESASDIEGVLSDEWWRNTIVFAYGARPSRGDELAVLIRDLDEGDGIRAYRSLVTIGLALQACYQTNVETRRDILGGVIVKLGRCFEGFLKDQEYASTYPLNQFVFHFLEARDSVSSDQILLATPGASTSEYVTFLRLTGAIESGFIEQVREEVLGFEPTDMRLLLALYMLAFFVQHLRLSSSAEKAAAREISEVIGPKIQPLISQVIKEFKGIVLELQQGHVTAIDATLVTPEGQYEIDYEGK